MSGRPETCTDSIEGLLDAILAELRDLNSRLGQGTTTKHPFTTSVEEPAPARAHREGGER